MELSAILRSMEKSSYKKWFEAFKFLISKEKRGVQARLAKTTKKSTKHINDVVKGRRNASQELQEALANALGYTYEDMLRLGNQLLSKEPEPFPDYDKIMRLPLFDRAYAIVKKAAEANKIMQFHSALGDRRTWKELPPPVADFMAGKITEPELYEYYVEFFRQRIARLEEALLKGE